MRWTGGDFRVIIYKNGQLNKKRHIGCANVSHVLCLLVINTVLGFVILDSSTVETFPIQRSYK